MFIKRFAITFLFTAVAAAPVVLAQTTTTTTTRNISIGPVGVGSTETIQINVANLASNSSNGTAASCTGSITFNNSTGNAIGTSTPFTVNAGQIFSASLPFARLTSGTTRVEVFGVIGLTTSSTARTPCSLRYSLETFDTATGATHTHLGGEGDVAVTGFGGGGAGC